MARKRRVKLQSDAALGESSSHRGPDSATPGFRVKRARRVKLQSDAALGESSSHRGPDLATPGFRVKRARISRPSVDVVLTDEVCFLLLTYFFLNASTINDVYLSSY